MSASGRATEFMRAWGEGHNKPHNPDHRQWGADDCDACTTDAYDSYEALVHAADIMGWRPPDPAPSPCGHPAPWLVGFGPCDSPAGHAGIHTWPWLAPPQIKREPGTCVFGHPLPHLMNACPGVVGQAGGGDPAGSDTGVADSGRGQ